MQRTDIIERIKDVSKLYGSDAKLWIYGSQARSEAREDSDIDVLIIVDRPHLSFDDRMKLVDPLFEVELETGVSINPHIETTESWERRSSVFTKHVNQDRIAL